MKLRRVFFRLALAGFALVLLVALTAGGIEWWLHPSVQRQNGIVYGHRNGRDLTLDVLKPAHSNDGGIAFIVSGGWKSKRAGELPTWLCAPLLRRGYTVFAIYHVSQPRATVMEIFEDVSRGMRFVRHHAREYGVDPDRIAAIGGSAGAHLSLLLATRGGPGPADAKDPVDRESSAPRAVAVFFPVTDLLNLGASTENPGDGGPPKSFVKAFGPNSTNLAAWKVIGRDLSPIYWVSSNTPPSLIYHGDADMLTPLDQSQRYQARARELGRTVELVVRPGGAHGWLTMLWDLRALADWFDQHLRDGGS